MLVALGRWAGADLELSCTDVHWQGLGAGAGRLSARQVRVRSSGRGIAPGGRRAGMLLPARSGAMAAVQESGVGRVERIGAGHPVRAAG